MKYAQTLVLYSSINIVLFMKILNNLKLLWWIRFYIAVFELFEGLDTIIDIRFTKIQPVTYF